MNYYWFFTTEWDGGGKNVISLYGRRSVDEIDRIIDDMNKYSPFDYVSSSEFRTEDEYRKCIELHEKNSKNGYVINNFEK